MSLTEPDTGELLDRLTILSRKILERPENEHFKREQTQIMDRLGKWQFSEGPLVLLLELAAVNAALWQADDEIRALRGNSKSDIADAGCKTFMVQSLNDRRAEIVQSLNETHGMGRKEEKIR